MRRFNRRSVLKTMAKASAVAAMAPIMPLMEGCWWGSDYSLTLNLVLHGLFVINVTDYYIELLTPRVHDHIYKAGNWDIREVHDLKLGQDYALRGVNPAMQAPVQQSDCDIDYSQSDCKFTVHAGRSYCRLWLPFPKRLALLRCTTSDSPQPQPSDPHHRVIYKLSLCQVLVYDVKDYRALHVEGLDWKPQPNRGSRTANLHLWAEPPWRLSPAHAYTAYSKLSELLDPLYLELGVFSKAPLDENTGIVGLPREQEQGWADWASGGGEGAWPTDCCSVITRK